MNIAHKQLVLMLNANWQPIGQKLVCDAIVDLCGGINSFALDIQYDTDKNGNPVGGPTLIRPVSWDEWITLPVRNWDFSISSANLTIRVPTVLVAKNYHKMPKKTFRGKPSTDDLWIRDGGVDQYTGKKIERKNASADHVIPKSRGGGDTWENLVITEKKINSVKGNKLNNEVGLKLIRQPKKPDPVPVSKLIKEAKHIDHEHFIEKQ